MHRQSDSPAIELVTEPDGATTLYIDNGQAMQAWELDLMHRSADILCSSGSEFLEVGLGLGLSALRIATHPNTRRHVVVEKYQEVIDLFTASHPDLPGTLTIVRADFVDYFETLAPASVDGIFFDPYLPEPMRNDRAFWDGVMPAIVRSLRPEAAFIPCFTTSPILSWIDYFERVVVERRAFVAYDTTEYTYVNSGDAYIQCYWQPSPGDRLVRGLS
ncbi:MAG: methyltransferase [Acidobacteria bacterium]|nr:methyltransferase [Acidobacteriota bacterium]